MSTSKLNRSRMNRLFEKVPTRKDGRHEPKSTSELARATGLKRIAAYRLLADMEARGWIQSVMGQDERPCRPPVVEEIMMMTPSTARTGRESAHRLSDCVTALLRDQPFFGSLALTVADPRRRQPRDARERRPRDPLFATVGRGYRRRSHQDGNRARGADLHFEAPHAAARARSGTLAARLAARHSRAAARRGLHPAARR